MEGVSTINTIMVDIIRTKVLFSVGFSYDEIISELEKDNCDGWIMGMSQDRELIESSNYVSMSNKFKIGEKKYTHNYIIIKEYFTYTDFEMCKLAHECLHICQYVLPYYFDVTKEHEFFAYIHTYLMEQCLKIIRNADADKVVKEKRKRRKQNAKPKQK